mmetsp:Transcript_103076/g.268488  ORF Transcript_103076/g.268488 Transcript_103076/m.268488 type:complete len:507 (+) Transcript_103076:113-1633(+)
MCRAPMENAHERGKDREDGGSHMSATHLTASSVLVLGRLHDQRAPLLVRLHDRLGIVALPEAVGQNLNACVVHLLPAVEAAALAHGADPARAHVVDVVEEHLVPAVAAAESERHECMEHGPGTLRVPSKELVPHVRVVEVGDEDPGQGEAHADEARDQEHEAPSLAEGPAQADRAKQPDASPKEQLEADMLGAHRQPLVVEALVALATRAGIRKVQPPQASEREACVVGTYEVPEGHQGHCEPAVPLKGQLLEGVEPVGRVPSELAVVEQIEGRVVVPVVFHDEVHPRDRDEICQRVRDVVLPLVRREGGAVDHIVQNVHVLDAEDHHDEAVDERGHAEREDLVPQHGPIRDDVEALQHENHRVDVPHVDFLLRADLGEHEGQIRRHRLGDVRRRDGTLSRVAALVLVNIERQHLACLLPALLVHGALGLLRVVAAVRRGHEERGQLIVLLVFFRELLQVLVRAIKNRELSVLCLGLRPIWRRQQRLCRSHDRPRAHAETQQVLWA